MMRVDTESNVGSFKPDEGHEREYIFVSQHRPRAARAVVAP